MYSSLCLLALLGCASASLAPLLWGIHGHHDDGQWRPELDGSILGSGHIQWGHDDGSWKPHLDGSIHGLGLGHGIVGLGHGLGHLGWLHHVHRRSLWGVNPNALNVPLDTAHVAHAKAAQLVQQASEGARNIHGGGVPLHLPADTHEVAVGKQAHAIAHATQTALTAHHGWAGHGWAGHGWAGHGLAGHGWAGAVAAAPVGVVGAWGLGHHGLGWGVHGHHGLW